MRGIFKTILLSGAIAVAATAPRADSRPGLEEVLGPWLTGKKGAVIDIYECGNENELCGRIAWLREPYDDDSELKRDPHNPDESLRDRPLCGIEVFSGLERVDEDTWAHGRVYNPKDGRNYRAYLTLKDNGTVRIRGYMGIPLIGRSETWTRPEGIDVKCPSG